MIILITSIVSWPQPANYSKWILWHHWFWQSTSPWIQRQKKWESSAWRQEREWGGFHRNAISFLAAVIPASTNRPAALDRPIPDKSFSNRTGTVTGIVTDVKSDSWEATLAQNCSTGGHSHIMWMKIPGEFKLQRLQDGSVISFTVYSLRGVR